MIQNLIINQGSPTTVTNRYPTIQIVQVAVNASGSAYINTDNQRVSISGNGTFTQIKDPNTGLWHTVMVSQSQVVVGSGEA